MKKLQQFFAAVVLTLAIAFSVSAGDMLGPGVVSSPPLLQQSSVTGDIGTPGDMPCPGATALDPATEAALSLLQGLLALF